MRKPIIIITAIIVFIVIYSLLLGGAVYYALEKPSVTHFQDFADYQDDFTAVSNFLRACYVEWGETGRMVVDFSDGKIILNHGESILDSGNEQLTRQVNTIQSKGFSSAWVDEKSIIFWEDETKKYGLLFSESPIKAIYTTKKWYNTMRYKKLDRYWYEIGHLSAR